ncbi:MAG: hypothetical protein ACLFNQ_10505 [Spirochaetaceae bacterium]
MNSTRKSKTARKAEKQARKRRHTRLMIGGFVAVIVLTAGTVVLAQQLQARSFRNLSVVGSGTPTVVQVHDRACPVCTSLLGSVQEVRRDFDEEELHVRVAELHTEVGAAFARRYNAGRITLLLFDGDGNLVERQTGDQHPDDLRETFERLAAGEL